MLLQAPQKNPDSPASTGLSRYMIQTMVPEVTKHFLSNGKVEDRVTLIEEDIKTLVSLPGCVTEAESMYYLAKTIWRFITQCPCLCRTTNFGYSFVDVDYVVRSARSMQRYHAAYLGTCYGGTSNFPRCRQQFASSNTHKIGKLHAPKHSL